MAMIRWRPLGEVDSFRREMDRMFDNFFGSGSGEHGAINKTETVKDHVFCTVVFRNSCHHFISMESSDGN